MKLDFFFFVGSNSRPIFKVWKKSEKNILVDEKIPKNNKNSILSKNRWFFISFLIFPGKIGLLFFSSHILSASTPTLWQFFDKIRNFWNSYFFCNWHSKLVSQTKRQLATFIATRGNPLWGQRSRGHILWKFNTFAIKTHKNHCLVDFMLKTTAPRSTNTNVLLRQ